MHFSILFKRKNFSQTLLKWALLAFLLSYADWNSFAQTTTFTPTQTNNTPERWILEGTTSSIEGLGIADYSKFNPKKSWTKALHNAVNDLNANHSLIVSHYGYKVGQGPLRLRSDFAIRTFLDTTQVTVLDSARWKGHAFIRIKPTVALADSVLYPTQKFRPVDQPSVNTSKFKGRKWLTSTGTTPRIDSNWYMTVTKAKQDALRNLAENLAVKVFLETYQKGETTQRFYKFSTMYAFQRIRVLNRTFSPDTVKVQIAVRPQEVKTLMN